MPIDYSQYADNWPKISYFIRKYRAKDQCEWCGVPNGRVIARLGENEWALADAGYQGMSMKQLKAYNEKYLVPYHLPRFTRIVLTVAHIDQDKTNNRFHNLAALCQACHLHHDRHQHARNRRYGRNHKVGQLNIFE